MSDQIIENYPITPDMMKVKRRNENWPFKSFKVGSAFKTQSQERYEKAKAAALRIGHRKNWSFNTQWSGERNEGLIVRIV